MKRKIALVLSVVMLTLIIAQPHEGQAATQLDKINQQINALQKEINRKAAEKKNAEKNVRSLTNQVKATQAEIEALLKQIDEVGVKMNQTEKQIQETEEKLRQAGQELEEALQREKSTSEKLDSRVRLMYTNGSVSYFDVLLSATSFSDFISRFDAMQMISTQTRDLLEEQKALRQQIEQKEAEIARDLEEVKKLYEQVAAQKAELESKEAAKEKMVAQLNAEIEHSEEISEESERELMELARKMSQLEAEKNKIKTYYTGGKLGMPLKDSYRLSSPYGYRIHPITGKKTLHSGIDMAAPQGTPIYAAESGVVIVAQWWSGYGNAVIIDHGGGLWTLYGHIKNGGILVKKGDTVKRGEKIALVGSTGNSTGPHLHFEVRKNSEPVEPSAYLK